MKNVATKALFAAACAAGILAVSAEDVLWVDRNKGIDGAGRGTSESMAFRSIQAAVNAAPTGAEIRVKPGVYDEGQSLHEGWNNRVLIKDKVLRIVSTGGRDVTHITGRGVMRCIFFNNAAGSTVEGFTIRDGAVPTSNDGEVKSSAGAAIGLTASRGWSKSQGCIVDCVVSNCVGFRGGAFRSVTVVRSFVTENYAYNSGGAGRVTDFVNCLITRNGGVHTAIYENSKVVNSTVVDNARHIQSATVVNSVVHNNSDGSGGENNFYDCTFDHSLTRGDGYDSSPRQFVAPLYDDFRVLKGSAAETAADASLIASSGVKVPAGVDLYLDFDGKEFAKSGAIAAGCIQTVVEPKGGAIVFNGDVGKYLTRGRPANGKEMYAFAETWPTQFTVQAVNKGNPSIFCFIVNNGTSDKYMFPTMDDTVHIVPPAEAGAVYSCSIQNPKGTYYVDPDKGFDNTDNGKNQATPFKTIQGALNKYYEEAKSAFGYVIRCAPGDYKDGYAEGGNVKNRIALSGNGIRVIGAGADKSAIWGEKDPASADGTGAGGMRCIYSLANRACVQGFTIRDGYVNCSSSGDDHDQRGGGVYQNANATRNTRLHVLDCVITNCHAYRGGAGYSGVYERCRIAGSYGNGGVMRYATLVSSVVENLAGSEMTNEGKNNYFGLAVNTVFIGRGTDEYVVGPGTGTEFLNCIIMNTKGLSKGLVAENTLAWNVPEFTVESGIALADPMLADIAAGDLRPIAYWSRRSPPPPSSPALGAGKWFDIRDIAESGTLVNITDFTGAPLNLIGGNPTIGAYQWPKSVKELLGLSIFVR